MTPERRKRLIEALEFALGTLAAHQGSPETWTDDELHAAASAIGERIDEALITEVERKG